MRAHCHPRPSAGLLSYMQPFPEDQAEDSTIKMPLYVGNKGLHQIQLQLEIFLKEFTVFRNLGVILSFWSIFCYSCSYRDLQGTTFCVNFWLEIKKKSLNFLKADGGLCSFPQSTSFCILARVCISQISTTRVVIKMLPWPIFAMVMITQKSMRIRHKLTSTRRSIQTVVLHVQDQSNWTNLQFFFFHWHFFFYIYPLACHIFSCFYVLLLQILRLLYLSAPEKHTSSFTIYPEKCKIENLCCSPTQIISEKQHSIFGKV